MLSPWSRRRFLLAGAGAAAGVGLPAARWTFASQQRGSGAVAIASGNGLRAVARALELVSAGADPLDAAIAGVNIVEDDPTDRSVGLGGLPNEDGVVELDASVMHGPTHKAGAVAALRNIRNPSKVARLVMLRTDHVLLVGEGALRFAKAHGFEEENLLTDEARRQWLDWKERHSDNDAWLPPASRPADSAPDAAQPRARVDWRESLTHGTINLLVRTAAGDLAGVTSTSGLSNKLPGRVGDSPIIGAGLYVDNDIGAAGSTGRGEANLQNCSSYAIVEAMGRGMEPAEACLAQLRRVAEKAEPRLRGPNGRPTFALTFFALRKDGLYGCAVMASEKPPKFAVADGRGSRLEVGRGLYS